VIYGGKREYALAQRLDGKPLDPGKITGLRDNLLCHRQHKSLGIGGRQSDSQLELGGRRFYSA
jgi:hypothetical protein